MTSASSCHSPHRSGYNLLLYGFGSKRTLVDRFAREVLTDGALVSVNGFNPLVNAKQVALGVASAIAPGNHRWVRQEPSSRCRSLSLTLDPIARISDL